MGTRIFSGTIATGRTINGLIAVTTKPTFVMPSETDTLEDYLAMLVDIAEKENLGRVISVAIMEVRIEDGVAKFVRQIGNAND